MSAKFAREKNSLDQRIAGLSPEKRTMLERLLRREQRIDTGIHPRDRSLDPPPVTFAQEQLWFLDQLAPGNAFYNESSALHVSFPVNTNILQNALNEVARRHETIRTTFTAARGELVQVISPQFTVPLLEIDLSGLASNERDAEARRLAMEDAHRPFDLTIGPLIRTTLLRTAREESIFLLTMHHIIFDGWSFTILLSELSDLYEAFAAGRPSPLPELAIQYADFAVWQRGWLRGEALKARLGYWRKQLADLPLLHLPTDHPRPAVQSFTGARCNLTISRRLWDSVRALSIAESVTPFMTLLTTFKTLLHRYADDDEIVVGVPVANRDRVEIEGLIGFFVNTLVMRTDLSGDPTFREALGRVRKIALEAFEHQDVPFEKLVEELKPERDLSRNPLFQVTFQIYGWNSGSTETDTTALDSSASPFEIDARAAKFDLRFDLAEHPDGLTGFLEYDTALFEPETVSRLADHFQTLLGGVVANPALRLSELPLLSAAERRELLERNVTATPYPRQARIHELFEQQVARSPDAVALQFEHETLSYTELNSRANRLASYLRRLGVGSATAVGISGERSLEMIVGLLAILKAGGVYVPLAIDEPRERFLFTIKDADVRIILTRERQLSQLSNRGVRVIPLSVESAEIGRQPDHNLGLGGCSTDLAYIMFTSGSTGRPKGVCVPHRAVVRLVAQTNFFSAAADDVFLQFAPVTFDASTFEIWGALLNGARLVVFPPYVPSLEELGETIARNRVTTLWLTAALFRQMVDLYLESLAGLRHLLAGGDVLSVAHVRRFMERHPHITLTNGYGPTENTTFTCTYSTADPAAIGASFPIGKPIANTQVYVLDRYRNPVPFGVPGELFAAGDGLARNYLNLPELTAQNFLPDPFSADPAARMYATGDYVRYRPDGNLDFLGRADNQVKIRGFRVELEETESLLRTHPAVRDAVCTVREETAGDKRMVAYIVGNQAADKAFVSAAEFRRFLEERLPDYFVPSTFVSLDALPLTAHGKVDRAALPAPGEGRPQLDGTYAGPQTETERVVTALWQEVLGLQNVGIHDNFFDLGGHSLLVVLLHNRLKESFRNELSIVDLFRYPTIASLSSLLSPEEARAQAQ
jgi:amino acid adenylation domain-containing protein